jgi:hypothetical protein
MLSRVASLLASGLALLLVLGSGAPAHAQDLQPRYGVSFQMLGSTADDNIGPGLRFRVSAPLNRDLSVAFGTSLTGFIFGGRDDADFSIDPQASLIVTVPSETEETTYFFGGAGAYVPLGSSATQSGPTFHLGAGKVWLLQESSLFVEVNPALLIAADQTELLFPVRVGVIF